MQATVLLALLQPAPETYELFDDVLLLSEGGALSSALMPPTQSAVVLSVHLEIRASVAGHGWAESRADPCKRSCRAHRLSMGPARM